MNTNPPKPIGACLRTHPRRDGEKGIVWKIHWPEWLPTGPEIGDRLLALRKEAIAHRDVMIAFQKAAGSDREAAKFFKVEATDALKFYRAICVVVPMYVTCPPKDCPTVDWWQWPVELAPAFDRVINEIHLM